MGGEGWRWRCGGGGCAAGIGQPGDQRLHATVAVVSHRCATTGARAELWRCCGVVWSGECLSTTQGTAPGLLYTADRMCAVEEGGQRADTATGHVARAGRGGQQDLGHGAMWCVFGAATLVSACPVVAKLGRDRDRDLDMPSAIDHRPSTSDGGVQSVCLCVPAELFPAPAHTQRRCGRGNCLSVWYGRLCCVYYGSRVRLSVKYHTRRRAFSRGGRACPVLYVIAAHSRSASGVGLGSAAGTGRLDLDHRD